MTELQGKCQLLRLRACTLYRTLEGFGLDDEDHARMTAIGLHKAIWDEEVAFPVKVLSAVTLSELSGKNAIIQRLLMPSRATFADRLLVLMG